MFGLDPESIVQRVKASGQSCCRPSLQESVLRGAVGFTLVSMGGFAPWVLAGRWFYRNVGEAGLYAACALAFIGLSGCLLHRLIIGPGAVVRFYQLFSVAFVAYAVAWTVGWMTLGGVLGGLVGLLAGTVAMGVILAWGFRSAMSIPRVIAILFLTNVAGYFGGEWAHNALADFPGESVLGVSLDRARRSMLSKTAWGLCYGIGFGAGIGWAFYACQARARKLLVDPS